MTILSICGVRGGCGATAIAAGLAWYRAEQARSTLLIDLCPQNLLRLHFGVPWSEEGGWRASLQNGGDWTLSAWQIGDGQLSLVPHGRFEPKKGVLPAGWLHGELERLARPVDDLVVLDTPLLYENARELAFSSASHVLVVLPADPISCVLSDKLEADLLGRGFSRHEILYVINQFDPARRLDRDVEMLLRKMLGKRVAPLPVMRDEAMREALAAGMPVAAFAPESQAAEDLKELSVWLAIRMQQAERQVA
ncbi:cellulose biosynthesis protein BcsQ [Chromobacterium sp. IIBBL 290-4]|uniref:cellulose biosynthesis protein BcsQ n=1 Tax=Chromobacterium sp. IIBBL 290-4 TaxID=2953890 RepID=UPI0020B7A88E|nr:cellulose biosynthesis protein BcsQ [Chromobacterium sp. IIBBL 290-4]UTH73439.1 cellulose biosynthesis protein BcsQ [Chromobacterium sp. IIBBL 290-4]